MYSIINNNKAILSKFFLFLSILVLSLSMMSFSFADEDTGSLNENDVHISDGNPSGYIDNHIPSVHVDDAERWIESKGGDFIRVLQKFGQPLSLGAFIISGFFAILGAIGNSKLLGKAITGMVISIIAYAGITVAPELMAFFTEWLTT